MPTDPHSHTVVYAVGGTGAKLAEGLVYLAAAGLIPRRLSLRLVDQDDSNGNAQRAARLLLSYRRLQEALGLPLPGNAAHLLDARIAGDGRVMTVLPRNDTSLNAAFGVAARPDFERDIGATLMHALYSAEERDARMSIGFSARPAVGCAAFLSPEARAQAPVWSAITADLAAARAGAVQQFLLLGSIFGGTGAAGVPSLARELRAQTRSIGSRPRVGAVLGLRYFDVQRPPAGGAYGPVVFARMRAALTHYDQALGEPELVRPFDDLYLFGLDLEQLVPYEPNGGGATQANPPLTAELIGALGAVDFLGRPPPVAGDVARVWVAGRAAQDRIEWNDLPSRRDDEPVAVGQTRVQAILDFARFCYAYCYGFHATEKLSRTENLHDFVSLWRFLGRADIEDGRYDDIAAELANFCLGFLGWFASVQSARGAELLIRLGGLDAALLRGTPTGSEGREALQPEPKGIATCAMRDVQRIKRGFDDLRSRGKAPGLARIVDLMATSRRRDDRPFHDFIRALFEASRAGMPPLAEAEAG